MDGREDVTTDREIDEGLIFLVSVLYSSTYTRVRHSMPNMTGLSGSGIMITLSQNKIIGIRTAYTVILSLE